MTFRDLRTRESPLRVGLLLGASAAMLLLLIYLGRWLTFWFDEWNFVLDRQDLTIDTLLAPHVDHLSAVPVLIYQGLMRGFGLGTYWPWLGVLWACHFGSVALLYRVTTRSAGPWLGAMAALSLLTLGCAFEDLLQAFQLSFLLSTLFGLLAVERLQSSAEIGRRDALVAAGALAIATASSSVGVIFLGLVLAWGVFARRRAIVLAAVPVAAAYAVWFIAWRHASAGPIGGNPADPTAPVRSLIYGIGAAIAGVTGLPPYLYAAIGLIVGAAVVVRLRFERLGPSVLGIAALLALVAMYALQAVFRAGFGVEHAARSGYLYPAAIFIWIAMADVLRNRRSVRLRRSTIGLVMLAVALAIAGNLWQLVGSGRAMRGLRANELAELRLISANRAVAGMAIDVSPDEELVPQVTARRYLTAIARFGEPRVAAEPDPVTLATLVEPGRLNRAAIILFSASFGRASLPMSTPPEELLAGPSGSPSDRPGCVVVGTSAPVTVSWRVASGYGFSVSPPSTGLRLGLRPSELADLPADAGIVESNVRILMPSVLAGAIPWFAELDAPSATMICQLTEP